ncbi:MAG TPA: hypothetical protein VFH58_09900 [Acidimicrobiales bacterium]|nr:hypothetical protein [Acidimicrobiales bacterium]
MLAAAAAAEATTAFAAVPGGLAPAVPGAAAAPALDASSFQLQWSQGPFASDQYGPIAESSPTVATLDGGGPSAVVGDRSGYLYAFHLSDGSAVTGWPKRVGAPIDSTPSVRPMGPGLADQVLVGSGNAFVPTAGGYNSYGPDSTTNWYRRPVDPPSDYSPSPGVQASLTVTNLQGRPSVFAASLGQVSYSLSADGGQTLRGWPFFTADSTFSTAAAADLYGTGRNELVVGGASTAGQGLGQRYPQGGHLRILNPDGGLICHYDTTQEVDSSPAVGTFLPGAATGIVVGTGSYWPNAGDTDTLQAFDTHCRRIWSDRLDGVTSSSPALADVNGDGRLEAVEGTDNGSGGSVWIINPADGQVLRGPIAVTGRVIGSVVTADLTGQGHQDLIVPTTLGTDVIDGLSGATVAVLSQGGYQNSPLVTRDPNGAVGITIAGYNGSNEGVIFHYEVTGSNGAAAVGPASWPMFHHDPQLTGVSSYLPLRGEAPCTVPDAARPGYDLVASDGGVFSFGQPFCGSTGGIRLARPIVGAAVAPGTGGYWMVASDGGIFSFGGARFYGSTGNVRLAAPVVAMTATPDGRGYWMTGSDGGLFGFGDARYYGSLGGIHLVQPVVGMTATADGQGYWLVTRDGGVFAFGDAGFLGSTGNVHLAHPIVAMAEDRATGGYWLVGSDGGVFAFGAPFLGSTGSVRLTSPIVGITATEDGRGYWLVAPDGGVFAFGDAGFHGSTGGIRLSRPVVALAGMDG